MDDSELKQLMEANGAETRRHFDVAAEALRRDLRVVAEGVIATNTRIDKLSSEMKTEFAETRAMIRFSYAELDRRLRTLEEVVASLQTRMERLESTPPQ